MAKRVSTKEAENDGVGGGQRINVAVRVRPFSKDETKKGKVRANDEVVKCFMRTNEIQVGSSKKAKKFQFDFVAPPDTTQEELFLRVGVPVADECAQGYNATVFAYGQTGSGKTFTMQGPDETGDVEVDFSTRGLIPRTLDHLFGLIDNSLKAHPSSEFEVMCSYYEIYNEDIFDLLQPFDSTSTPLTARESAQEGPFVQGLMHVPVTTAEEARGLLMDGAGRRRVGATQLNRQSSRSHSVFCLTVTQQTWVNGFAEKKFSKLNLVDLAGSERQKQTGTDGSMLKEASSINKSLVTLGTVIRGLVEKSRSDAKRHINYRDSKLTYLLRESLGGNSFTWVIANVSPAFGAFSETMSTLNFASRAQMVCTNATLNAESDMSVDGLKAQVLALSSQLEESEAKVAAYKESDRRRRSARLSIHPQVSTSPIRGSGGDDGDGNGGEGGVDAEAAREKLRLLAIENQRLNKLVAEREHSVEALRSCDEKRRGVVQQLQFIVRLSSHSAGVLRDAAKGKTVDDATVDKLVEAATRSEVLASQAVDRSHLVSLSAENRRLVRHVENIDDDYQRWLVDNDANVRQLQDTVAFLSNELQHAQQQAAENTAIGGNTAAENAQLVEELTTQLAALETEVTEMQSARAAGGLKQQDELAEVEAETQRLRTKAEDADRRCNDAQFKVRQLTEQLEKTAGVIERAQEDFQAKADEAETAAEEANLLRERLEQSEKRAAAAEAERDAAVGEVEAARKEAESATLDTARRGEENRAAELALCKARTLIEEKMAEAETQRERIEELEAATREKDLVVQTCMSDMAKLREELSALPELHRQLDTLEHEKAKLADDLAESQAAVEETGKAARANLDTIEALRREAQNLESQLGDARRRANERERYNERVVEDLAKELDTAAEENRALANIVGAMRGEAADAEEQVNCLEGAVGRLNETLGDMLAETGATEEEIENRLWSLIGDITTPAIPPGGRISHKTGPLANTSTTLTPSPSTSSSSRRDAAADATGRNEASIGGASPAPFNLDDEDAVSSLSPIARSTSKPAIQTPLSVSRDLGTAELASLRRFKQQATRELDDMESRVRELSLRDEDKQRLVTDLEGELQKLTLEREAESSSLKDALARATAAERELAAVKSEASREAESAVDSAAEKLAELARLKQELDRSRADAEAHAKAFEVLREAEAELRCKVEETTSNNRFLLEENRRLRAKAAEQAGGKAATDIAGAAGDNNDGSDSARRLEQMSELAAQVFSPQKYRSTPSKTPIKSPSAAAFATPMSQRSSLTTPVSSAVATRTPLGGLSTVSPASSGKANVGALRTKLFSSAGGALRVAPTQQKEQQENAEEGLESPSENMVNINTLVGGVLSPVMECDEQLERSSVAGSPAVAKSRVAKKRPPSKRPSRVALLETPK